MRGIKMSNKIAYLSTLILLTLGTVQYGFAQQCEVQFSQPSGWYTTDVQLILSCEHSAIDIYYTLDGETPTRESNLFDSPILITDISANEDRFTQIRTTIVGGESFLDRFSAPSSPVRKATVVRAIAIYPDNTESALATATYFVDANGADRYSFPVFSVVSDSVNWFSQENGIYVPGANYDGSNFRTANFAQGGVEWERPMYIEMFTSDGSPAFEMDAGMRIHGGFTRRAARKSLRMYARNDYSENRFPWPLLENRSETEYRRFILRNSGQQVYSTLFLDSYNQRILDGSEFAYTESSPAIMFLNGEYWGIHNIREFQDERFLESRFFVDRNEIDFLENDMEVRHGSSVHFQQMRTYSHHLILNLLNGMRITRKVFSRRVWCFCKAQWTIPGYLTK